MYRSYCHTAIRATCLFCSAALVLVTHSSVGAQSRHSDDSKTVEIYLYSAKTIAATYDGRQLQRRLVSSHQQLLADEIVGADGSTSQFVLHDHLGSNNVAVTTTGQVTNSELTWSFGEPLILERGNEETTCLGRYTGQQLDGESGWNHFGARYYDAVLGRFMAVDRLASMTPNYSAYAYAVNSPMRFTDVKGLQADDMGINDPNLDWDMRMGKNAEETIDLAIANADWEMPGADFEWFDDVLADEVPNAADRQSAAEIGRQVIGPRARRVERLARITQTMEEKGRTASAHYRRMLQHFSVEAEDLYHILMFGINQGFYLDQGRIQLDRLAK